jgi:hypothetical protein
MPRRQSQLRSHIVAGTVAMLALARFAAAEEQVPDGSEFVYPTNSLSARP